MQHILAGAVVAAISAAGILSSPAAGDQAPLPPPPDGSTATVTGCLGRGDAAGTFVLTRVTWTSTNTPAKDPAAHHGTSPPGTDRSTVPAVTADRPPAGETLRLAGAATRLKMDPHVGHTITATGMLAALDPVVSPGVVLPDPAQPGDTTSRTPTRAATDRPAAPNPRVLNLRSFTHVAERCKED